MSKNSKLRAAEAARAAEQKLIKRLQLAAIPKAAPQEIPPLSNAWSNFKIVCAVGCTCLGLILAAVALWYQLEPVINIYPKDTFSTKTPFHDAFAVKNECPLAIRDIHFDYLVNYIAGFEGYYADGSKANERFVDNLRLVEPESIPELRGLDKRDGTSVVFPGKVMGIGEPAVNGAFSFQFTYCDVQITVDFKNPLWFGRTKKAFRFVTRVSDSGVLIWDQKSIGESIVKPPHGPHAFGVEGNGATLDFSTGVQIP